MRVKILLKKDSKPVLERTPVKVIVMIPCYNEGESIGDTIESLKNQSRPPDYIIVGDDQSTDDTAFLAVVHGAEVILHKDRQGNKAFNQQAILDSREFKRLISGDNPENIVVIVIDGDTIIDPKGLEILVAPFETDPDVAAASGYVIPQETKTWVQKSRLVEYHYTLNLQKTVQNEFGVNLVISGCFCALRLSSIYKNHGFDTRTITEDFGLTCHQHLNNEKILFVKAAVCYTKEPPTLGVYVRQLDRWYRGFFQNLAIHRKGITSWTNWKFSLLISFLCIEAVFGLTIPYMMWYLYHHGTWINITRYWAVVFGVEFLIMIIPAMLGANRFNQKWETFSSIPLFYIMRFVTMFMFWRSLVLEWILNRKLNVWNKGH